MRRVRHIRLIFVLNLMASVVLGTGLALWTPDLPRAELEARYLASPADLVEVAGTMLHLRDRGPRDAPAVIMIHGFGASLHTWAGWQDRLAAERRVVSFDLPGLGLSPPDATGDYSDRRVTEIVLAIMDQLGLERADLVGNSIGGRIAFTFAARHPERVRKLVLVSPDGYESPGRGRARPRRGDVNHHRHLGGEHALDDRAHGVVQPAGRVQLNHQAGGIVFFRLFNGLGNILGGNRADDAVHFRHERLAPRRLRELLPVRGSHGVQAANER